MQDPYNQSPGGPPIPPPSGYSHPSGFDQSPTGPQIPPGANNKLAAGLCGLFLGGLGVHKFILGYTTEGIIMLLAGLLGGLVTCGIATGVVGVIGMVEGIIYLTKTDQEFYQMYVVNKKPWF